MTRWIYQVCHATNKDGDDFLPDPIAWSAMTVTKCDTPEEAAITACRLHLSRYGGKPGDILHTWIASDRDIDMKTDTPISYRWFRFEVMKPDHIVDVEAAVESRQSAFNPSYRPDFSRGRGNDIGPFGHWDRTRTGQRTTRRETHYKARTDDAIIRAQALEAERDSLRAALRVACEEIIHLRKTPSSDFKWISRNCVLTYATDAAIDLATATLRAKP